MKVFASPSRYIQGKDVLFTSLDHIKALGTKPLVLCDDVVYDIVGKKYLTALSENEFSATRVAFNGEASDNEVNRVVAVGKAEGNDVVIGLGGGKTLDSAKAIADLMGVPVVIAPTIASTDAPCSALSVIYTDEGAFDKYIFYSKNPELVVVDTKVISQAPTRLLASGIADGLATWVEARAVLQKNGETMAGGYQTLAGIAIAQTCERTLFAKGLEAMASNKAKVVTKALEEVVEANTLLSGLGFESAGLAAAHAIHNGFTALTGDIHHLTHGEKVAYGTLTQLVLENAPKEELDKYIHFYQSLGLPTTLKELHLENASYEDLLKVGQQATIEGETIHQMPFKVTAEDVTAAILAVDAYVTNLAK
ncbi:iron-containing alcohol dehydrogenase [Granulicatella sp. zg-ZJ]|uniref:glycerol dehydrogenase n=1 Tax=unclassified Granulicatella TaxID=2630493 RepID=UPI0013C29DF1|nr:MULTISPECIES: glycerol dehydrogenase [unclassified Granulicatella]MBS4750524.1 glycerol dehydrogenase [Carnobacteriaceae bacterium zg-ZUI78]NEW62533.1 iron-containing alcohol dehydrogenase [Granulicatella sp. zg-ZJ]NEW66081.1 iron-containing alcohol dehydrogenase [Granulicatella sp. zg-84]QMI85478.1 glycerol dehydrogenase [Carnobacteriaceae bacterium zg-84]